MKRKKQLISDELPQKSHKIAKKKLLYTISQRNYYTTDKQDIIIQEFIEPKTKEAKKSISSLRNKISSYLFSYLDSFHIPTHFINKITDNETLVKKSEPLPVILKIYNTPIKELNERLGKEDNFDFEFPIIEHYYKVTETNITWVNEHHLYALGILTPDEFKQLNRIASKANAVLRSLCDRRKLALVNIQFEFGRYKNQLVICGELSPLTIYFLDIDKSDNEKRNIFTTDNPNLLDAYTLLNNRLELKI